MTLFTHPHIPQGIRARLEKSQGAGDKRSCQAHSDTPYAHQFFFFKCHPKNLPNWTWESLYKPSWGVWVSSLKNLRDVLEDFHFRKAKGRRYDCRNSSWSSESLHCIGNDEVRADERAMLGSRFGIIADWWVGQVGRGGWQGQLEVCLEPLRKKTEQDFCIWWVLCKSRIMIPLCIYW